MSNTMPKTFSISTIVTNTYNHWSFYKTLQIYTFSFIWQKNKCFFSFFSD